MSTIAAAGNIEELPGNFSLVVVLHVEYSNAVLVLAFHVPVLAGWV